LEESIDLSLTVGGTDSPRTEAGGLFQIELELVAEPLIPRLTPLLAIPLLFVVLVLPMIVVEDGEEETSNDLLDDIRDETDFPFSLESAFDDGWLLFIERPEDKPEPDE